MHSFKKAGYALMGYGVTGIGSLASLWLISPRWMISMYIALIFPTIIGVAFHSFVFYVSHGLIKKPRPWMYWFSVVVALMQLFQGIILLVGGFFIAQSIGGGFFSTEVGAHFVFLFIGIVLMTCWSACILYFLLRADGRNYRKQLE